MDLSDCMDNLIQFLNELSTRVEYKEQVTPEFKPMLIDLAFPIDRSREQQFSCSKRSGS